MSHSIRYRRSLFAGFSYQSLQIKNSSPRIQTAGLVEVVASLDEQRIIDIKNFFAGAVVVAKHAVKLITSYKKFGSVINIAFIAALRYGLKIFSLKALL